jgi:predicted membrane protein
MSQPISNQRNLIAIILIVFAGVLFVNNVMDLNLFNFFRNWWPLVIIVLGLSHMLSAHGNKKMGLVFLIVGIIFQLSTLNRLNFTFFDLFWPAILLIIGINLLSRNSSFNKTSRQTVTESDYLDLFTIFSGAKNSYSSTDFKGGNLTAMFGGMEVDLSNIQTKEKEVTLHITAMFGGIDVVPPKGWKIITRGTPLFGGFDDDRKKDLTVLPDAPVLYVHYFVMFGGASLVDTL